MAASLLEQYRVNDFLEWHRGKSLVLNPIFQRRSVWTPAARVFLIDTLLRGLPIPKVYMRTTIDVASKKTQREIVDGQQRLRAIIDFESDEFALTKRAREFEGLRYTMLPDDLKGQFLGYPIAVDQLLNASDSDVLEVFARLNSYTVSLNDAEKRHAEFQGDFKWSVHQAARRWSVLWEKFGIIGTRQRLRMADDAFMAEMFGILLEGVGEASQSDIRRIYAKYDPSFPQEAEVNERIDKVLALITGDLADAIVGPLASAPHFVMLFSVVAHAVLGLPGGQVDDGLPTRNPEWLTNVRMVRANLQEIAALIESRQVDGPGGEFVLASLSNMHRMKSRRVRLPIYSRALEPRQLVFS